MATWIIDDGPLNDLSLVVDSSSLGIWPHGEFKIADATARDASGSRKALLEAEPSPFGSFSVMMNSEAARILYDHLRQPTTSDKNLAEHQSIAWALAEAPDAILVARDKRAAFLALAELGRGGAAHPTELRLHLRDQRLITPDQFNDLCKRTSQGEQNPIPLRCQNP